MSQSNLIIVKNSEACDILRKRGYRCMKEDVIADGWKAFYSWNKSEGIVSLVGSRALAFREKGKYPYQLSAADYKRAVKKEIDFLKLVILKQAEDDFATRAKKYYEVCKEFVKVQSARIPKDLDSYTSSEYFTGPPSEEEILLGGKLKKIEQDEVFVCAARYMGGIHYAWSPAELQKRLHRMSGCNYNMQEYRYYRRIFSRLLRYAPYIYFTYQDEEERKAFTLVKELSLNELRIGDLAMLCSNDMLKIHR